MNGLAARLPPGLVFPGGELLRSRRLRLRGLVMADGRELLRLHRDERVNAHLLDHAVRTPVEAAALVVWSNRIAAQHPGLGIWRADNEQGEFIGIYSLTPLDGGGEVELGCRLLTRAWGRLYPLEGGRALCRHAFVTLRLPRLLGLCDASNRAVPVVLRRLGFEQAGVCRRFGRDALRFDLSRERWEAQDAERETAAGNEELQMT